MCAVCVVSCRIATLADVHLDHANLFLQSSCSEPEVKLLNELAKSFKPSVWLNVHSGMEAMFTPWDHKAEVGRGEGGGGGGVGRLGTPRAPRER